MAADRAYPACVRVRARGDCETSTLDGDRRASSRGWPVRGLPLTVTDANGQVAIGQFDSLGRGLARRPRPGHHAAERR